MPGAEGFTLRGHQRPSAAPASRLRRHAPDASLSRRTAARGRVHRTCAAPAGSWSGASRLRDGERRGVPQRGRARSSSGCARRRRWVGVVGLSMGGALAARLAAEASRTSARSSLLAPYLTPHAIGAHGRRAPRRSGRLRDAVSRRARRRVIRSTILWLVARASRTVCSRRAPFARWWRRRRQARRALPAVTVPTLVVNSREDNRIPLALAEHGDGDAPRAHRAPLGGRVWARDHGGLLPRYRGGVGTRLPRAPRRLSGAGVARGADGSARDPLHDVLAELLRPRQLLTTPPTVPARRRRSLRASPDRSARRTCGARRPSLPRSAWRRRSTSSRHRAWRPFRARTTPSSRSTWSPSFDGAPLRSSRPTSWPRTSSRRPSWRLHFFAPLFFADERLAPPLAPPRRAEPLPALRLLPPFFFVAIAASPLPVSGSRCCANRGSCAQDSGACLRPVLLLSRGKLLRSSVRASDVSHARDACG